MMGMAGDGLPWVHDPLGKDHKVIPYTLYADTKTSLFPAPHVAILIQLPMNYLVSSLLLQGSELQQAGRKCVLHYQTIGPNFGFVLYRKEPSVNNGAPGFGFRQQKGLISYHQGEEKNSD